MRGTVQFSYNEAEEKDICNKCNSPIVQRKDDEPDTVRNRIHVYQNETSPLVDYYRKRKSLLMLTQPRSQKKYMLMLLMCLKHSR